MEYIMRCGVEKYLGVDSINNELDAIKKFNNNYIYIFASHHNQNEWRDENIHTIYFDNSI